MKTETAISAAAARAGMNMTETRLRGMIDDLFKKHHANSDRAIPAFWRMLRDDAECGQLAIAPFLRRAFDERAGRKSRSNDQISSSRGDNEQPTYKPGHSSRGAASIGAVQATMRAGLMFSVKASDGRFWGDIGWHELDGMDRDGVLARAIKRIAAVPSDRFATIATLINNKQFKGAVDEAQKQNDVS